DGPLIRGRTLRLRTQERRLECVPLGGRETSESTIVYLSEEVAQTRVRPTGLRLRRPRREDTEPLLTSDRDGLQPERRLADPRGSLEQESRTPLGDPRDEGTKRVELVLSTEDHGTPRLRRDA